MPKVTTLLSSSATKGGREKLGVTSLESPSSADSKFLFRIHFWQLFDPARGIGQRAMVLDLTHGHPRAVIWDKIF